MGFRGQFNGDDWDAERVIGVIKRDELIRRTDLILRAERSLKVAASVV